MHEDGEVRWELVDMAGRTVKNGAATISAGVANMTIELAQLEAGTYLVRIVPQNRRGMMQQMVTVR